MRTLSEIVGVVFFGGLAVTVVVLFAIWVRSSASASGASGKIISPANGRDVARRFKVEGELAAIPYGYHARLALRVGDLLFPRDSEIAEHDGHFSLEIEPEEAPHEPFSLVLMLVSAKGQRTIEYWLLQGALGEGYPGFERIPGASELDTVNRLVLRSERSPSDSIGDPTIRSQA